MTAGSSATGRLFGFPGRPEEARAAEADRASVRLILASLVVLVVIRFFTEVRPVLPRFANFVDIPIFAALVIAALMRPRTETGEGRRDISSLLFPAWLFLLVCCVATISNLSRIETAPMLMFMYGFLAPVCVYLAAYRLWPAGSSLPISRLIVGLGLLQLVVVVLIDLPRFFATDNPDEISGTFGENQYQLVFFLLVFGALLAGIFKFERNRRISRVAPFLFVAILGTIFLAQYRSLLITTGLAVVLVAVLLGAMRLRGVVFAVVAGALFVVTLNYTAQAIPFLKITPTVEALKSNPYSYVSERARALGHVGDLYNDNPRYTLTGTGPGTYSSRAWQTFALFETKSATNVAGSYVKELTGGKPYTTDVSDKYIVPRLRYGEVFQGSLALSSPYSDYSSLLAEVGIVGFIAIVMLYLGALLQAARITVSTQRESVANDPLPAIALATTTGFFVLLQMGVLQSWLEVTRLTFLLWILLAVVTKESDCRDREPPPVEAVRPRSVF